MTSISIAGQGISQAEPNIDYPRPDRLVSGNPKRTTHQAYQHPNMSCGIWECEVGAWNIVFADNKQEFFNVIEGLVRIHDQSGNFIEVSAGHSGIIPPGFVGTFEVVQSVKKYYVNVEVPPVHHD